MSLKLCPGKDLTLAHVSSTVGPEHDHVRGEDVSDTEDQTILRLGAEVGNGVLLGLPDFGSLSNEGIVSGVLEVHIHRILTILMSSCRRKRSR